MTSYEQSILDRMRLVKYAQRVARETRTPSSPAISKSEQVRQTVTRQRSVGFLRLRTEQYTAYETQTRQIEVIGPYWPLFTTQHWVDRKPSSRFQSYEYEESNVWALAQNGTLWKLWLWTSYTVNRAGPDEQESDATAKEMSDEDILELDREHQFSSLEDRDGHFRGNRHPGRVIRHAKGVGLSLIMKDLLAAKD